MYLIHLAIWTNLVLVNLSHRQPKYDLKPKRDRKRKNRNFNDWKDVKKRTRLKQKVQGLILASVGVTPRTTQLGVNPRTPLFEGKKPENKKKTSLVLERAGY